MHKNVWQKFFLWTRAKIIPLWLHSTHFGTDGVVNAHWGQSRSSEWNGWSNSSPLLIALCLHHSAANMQSLLGPESWLLPELLLLSLWNEELDGTRIELFGFPAAVQMEQNDQLYGCVWAFQTQLASQGSAICSVIRRKINIKCDITLSLSRLEWVLWCPETPSGHSAVLECFIKFFSNCYRAFFRENKCYLFCLFYKSNLS